MKRIAFALLALSLGGALAFGQDAAAPKVGLSGYLGAGAILSGSGVQDTYIQPADRNNGGPVDFRLDFTLAGDTTGLKFSLWNGTGSVATTTLQYTYAWASFLDKQLVTKVGLQDDNTTAGPINSLGSNDNGNGTGFNNAVKAKFPTPTSTATAPFINGSGNIPAFDAVFTPASVPGLALDYYLPFGWTSSYAPDAFGLSRIGAAYTGTGFKIVANYELDQTSGQGEGTNGPDPSLNFGLTFTGVENLTVRLDGSYATNSSATVVSLFEQDVGYAVKLNDTDTVTPYLFVREYLNAKGIAAKGVAAGQTGSFMDLEIMPQVSYTSGTVTYAVDADIYNSGATLKTNAVGTTYAIQPNVTFMLPGAQKVELAGSYGTLGSDVSDGNGAGQAYGTYFTSNLGQSAGWDLWFDYIYAF